MSLKAWYNKTAYLRRYNDTESELGPEEGDATYWTTITTISCALQTVGMNERFVVGTNIVFATHRMFCAVGTTIQNNDKIRIDSADYGVKGVENIMERGHHLEVMLERQT